MTLKYGLSSGQALHTLRTATISICSVATRFSRHEQISTGSIGRMTEQPQSVPSQGFGIPRAMLWMGVAALASVTLLLAATRTEALMGQINDLPAMALLIVALMIGIAFGKTDASGRLVEFAVRPRPLVLVSLVVFVVLAVGTLLVFGTTPLSSDEHVHLFQAQLFAQFKIVGSYPPGLIDQIIPPGYLHSTILVAPDGRAMAVTWPGWALLMTPFVWLGAPWLLGPAMASLGIYLIGRLACMLSGARAAAIAILLALTSGAFLVTGMSVYPSVGHMTLNLLFAWLLLRGGRRDAVLAGLVGGLALNLNNPLPHAAFALPWLIWLAIDRTRRGRLVWLAAGYAPWVVVVIGWFVETSSIQTFKQGDVPSIVNLPTLTVIGWRFWELVRGWAWAAPGLPLLAVIGWQRRPGNTAAWVFGASFVVVVVLYAFFPQPQGLGYGARYYQTAWGALPILAALLLVKPGQEVLTRVVVVAALAGLALVVPQQVLYAHDLAVAAHTSSASIQSLTAPGVNLYFIRFGEAEDSSITLLDDPSLSGTAILVSQGPEADQEVVDRWFPGARLLTSNSHGSGYARP
jgi:hypothetical protein